MGSAARGGTGKESQDKEWPALSLSLVDELVPLGEISEKAGPNDLPPSPGQKPKGPVLAIRQEERLAALPGLPSAKSSVGQTEPPKRSEGLEPLGKGLEPLGKGLEPLGKGLEPAGKGLEPVGAGRMLTIPPAVDKGMILEEPSSPGLAGFQLDPVGAAPRGLPGAKVLEIPPAPSAREVLAAAPSEPVGRAPVGAGVSATVLSFPSGVESRPAGGAQVQSRASEPAAPPARAADPARLEKAAPPPKSAGAALTIPPSAPSGSGAADPLKTRGRQDVSIAGVSGVGHPGMGYVEVWSQHSDLTELEKLGLSPLQARLDVLLQTGLSYTDVHKPASQGLGQGHRSGQAQERRVESPGLLLPPSMPPDEEDDELFQHAAVVPIVPETASAAPSASTEPWAEPETHSGGWEVSDSAQTSINTWDSGAGSAQNDAMDTPSEVHEMGVPAAPGSSDRSELALDPPERAPDSAPAADADASDTAEADPHPPHPEDAEALSLDGDQVTAPRGALNDPAPGDVSTPPQRSNAASPSGSWEGFQLESPIAPVPTTPAPVVTPEPTPEPRATPEEERVNKDSDPTLLFAGGTLLDLQAWGPGKAKVEPRPAAARRPSKFPLVQKVPLEAEVQTMLDENLVAPEESSQTEDTDEEVEAEASNPAAPAVAYAPQAVEEMSYPPAPFDLPTEPTEPEPESESHIEALQKRAKELVERQKLYGAVDAAALPKLSRKEQLQLFWESLEPPRQRVPRSALGAVVGGLASSLFILVFLLADALSSVPERPEMPVAERRTEALAQLNRERMQAQAELVRLAESVKEAAGQKRSSEPEKVPPLAGTSGPESAPATPVIEHSATAAQAVAGVSAPASTAPASTAPGPAVPSLPVAAASSAPGETVTQAAPGNAAVSLETPPESQASGSGKKSAMQKSSALEVPGVAPRGVRSPKVSSELRELMKRYQALGLESVRSFEHGHAEEYFKRALRIADELPDPKARTEISQELGRTLLVQGELIIHDPVVTLEDCRRAREYFVRARSLGYDGQRNRENLRAAERCLRSSSLTP